MHRHSGSFKRRTTIFSLLVSFLLLSTAGVGSAQEPLIWSDEFDGASVDTAAWNFETGGNGWGNQELQNYLAENASVSAGSLVIDIKRENTGRRKFTSARLTTETKFSFQYGRIEARIMVPDLADGLWPAWWTMGIQPGFWPDRGELDIMEMGSADAILDGVINRRVISAAHWDFQGSTADYGLSLDAPADLNGSWHIWEMTWTPEFINTYLDGQQIWEFDIRPIEEASLHEFHQPHFMLVNVAVGGTFTGILSVDGITAALPAQMLVDYIRLYDNGFTTNVTFPGGPVCGDGSCDAGEDGTSCPLDCGGGGACNNNGVCDPGEDCTTCSNDCISKTSGNPNSQYCCGDLVCEGAEDSANCAVDCGSGPVCGDGSCDLGEDEVNCPEDCPPSNCNNNNICEAGEDCNNCSNDCDSVTGGKPANRYCCGNGVTEGPEGDGRCDGNP